MKILPILISLLITSFANDYGFNFSVETEAINAFAQQLLKEQTNKSSQDNKLDFSGDGRPGRRIGGGSRSLCPSTPVPLTALVPLNNVGMTISDRPELWFYVPYTPQQVTVGEFVLQDRQENDVYRQNFNLPQTPGLVSFKLLQAAPPLAIDHSYRWYFKLYCGDSSSSTANFVEGWIKRIAIAPDLETRLKRGGEMSAYREYGNNLIWFDSLNSLAQLRLNKDNPQLESYWNKLLTAEGVGLDKLIQQPLIGAVKNITRESQ